MIINVDSDVSIATQIFDCLYAYFQSLDPNYKSRHSVCFNRYSSSNNINILLSNMPEQPADYDKYDLILFCNGLEYCGIGNDVIYKNLLLDNAYLLTQSKVTEDHPLRSKFIWMPGAVMLPLPRVMNFSYFYPQPYFNELHKQTARDGDLVFINGSNRSWRQYALDVVKSVVPAIPVVSTISSAVTKTLDCYFESSDDCVFRDFVNTSYESHMLDNVENYYNQTVDLGIDKKFGESPPGFFGLVEYFKYRCVLFPETSWLNNDLTVSEKIIKCLIHGSIPWPIGGANINSQYQEIGIQTAWSLLPTQLQCYDSILDHCQRYQQLAEAVQWASAHPEIFCTEQAQRMVDSNFRNIIEFRPIRNIMANFSQLIYDHSRRH